MVNLSYFWTLNFPLSWHRYSHVHVVVALFACRCCRVRESLLSAAYNDTRSSCGDEAAVTFVKMTRYLFTLSNAGRGENCTACKQHIHCYMHTLLFAYDWWNPLTTGMRYHLILSIRPNFGVCWLYLLSSVKHGASTCYAKWRQPMVERNAPVQWRIASRVRGCRSYRAALAIGGTNCIKMYVKIQIVNKQVS